MNNILKDIRNKVVGSPDNVYFDDQLIDYINASFFILNELGVGPKDPVIVDSSTEWSEVTEDKLLMESIRAYTHLKVRELFDPPTNSTLLDSMGRQIDQLEWRLRHAAEILMENDNE